VRQLNIPAVLLVVVGILLTACGPDAPSSVPVTGAPPTPVDGELQPDLLIAAANIEFVPNQVSVAAGVPFTIGFDNRDAGVPHDLVLTGLSGEIIAQTGVVAGPAHVSIQVPALAPGSYTFTCQVHPNMVGTLTAE